MNDLDVYDLGDAERTRPIVASAPKIRRARPRPAPRAPRSALPAAAGSLSLLVPGAGQMLVGEIRQGVFFASATAFLASLVWALLGTIDRLVPTLETLEVPPGIVVVGLGMALLAGCVVQVGAALQAQRLGEVAGETIPPHPVLAGLASLVVPGWGQLLAGHRRRATLFLGSLWALAAAWLAVSPPVQGVLSLTGVGIPAALRDDWGPIVLVGVSAAAWVVAVYDAAAGAHAERRR